MTRCVASAQRCMAPKDKFPSKPLQLLALAIAPIMHLCTKQGRPHIYTTPRSGPGRLCFYSSKLTLAGGLPPTPDYQMSQEIVLLAEDDGSDAIMFRRNLS